MYMNASEKHQPPPRNIFSVDVRANDGAILLMHRVDLGTWASKGELRIRSTSFHPKYPRFLSTFSSKIEIQALRETTVRIFNFNKNPSSTVRSVSNRCGSAPSSHPDLPTISMPIILPPELIEEIFDKCSNDLLTRCCLVNKLFLDLARSHLYRAIQVSIYTEIEYTISCPSMVQIFTHTKHLSLGISQKSFIPFLQQIYLLGRLESITQKLRSANTDESYLETIVKILSLPTLKRFRLNMVVERMCIERSRSLAALLASPKLRDFSASYDVADNDDLPGLCLQNLDTLRSKNLQPDFLSMDASTLRRQSFIIHFHPYQRPETFMNAWVASTTSHFITHLALDLVERRDLDEGVSLNTPAIPIFMQLHKLSFLTSLTFQIKTPSTTLSMQFEFMGLLIENISPKAPLRTVHIIIQPFTNAEENNFQETDSSWKKIPKILQHRFPNCGLFVYFQRYRHYYGFGDDEEGDGDEEDNRARFVQPQWITGVDRVYNIDDVPGRPFFSGEVTDLQVFVG